MAPTYNSGPLCGPFPIFNTLPGFRAQSKFIDDRPVSPVDKHVTTSVQYVLLLTVKCVAGRTPG